MAIILRLIQKKLALDIHAARELLLAGYVKVNGISVTNEKLSLLSHDEVTLKHHVVRSGKQLKYVLYFKPRGIECSMSDTMPDSLSETFPGRDVYPVGRLDKESEGLVLMTNDGRLYKAITTHDAIEKEYEVTVNRNISEKELQQLASGIEIMGSVTLPAIVKRCGDNKFRIILKEGRNRQIRRMCYKLKLEVEQLVRVRIHKLWLGELTPGEFRNATDEEIELLRSLYKHKFIAG